MPHSQAQIFPQRADLQMSLQQQQSQAPTATVQTPVGELPVYPTPDVTQYQYEETSGFYFDPTTGLYYDGNSQVNVLHYICSR